MLPQLLAVLPVFAPQRAGPIDSIRNSLASGDFWFKIIVVFAMAPLWVPVIKAIYHELEHAMRHEGGIWARRFSAGDNKRFEEKYGVYVGPLKSVPKEPRQMRRADARGASQERNARGGEAAAAGRRANTRQPGPAKMGEARAARATARSTGRGVSATRRRGF